MSSVIAQIVGHGSVDAQLTAVERACLAATSARQRLETFATAGRALVLGVLEVFHPHPHDLLHVDIARWMIVDPRALEPRHRWRQQ